MGRFTYTDHLDLRRTEAVIAAFNAAATKSTELLRAMQNVQTAEGNPVVAVFGPYLQSLNQELLAKAEAMTGTPHTGPTYVRKHSGPPGLWCRVEDDIRGLMYRMQQERGAQAFTGVKPDLAATLKAVNDSVIRSASDAFSRGLALDTMGETHHLANFGERLLTHRGSMARN
jgi:hypothetical protein